MPVTIKDVAALAGVSPSTVSRTCKDHPSISRQTKEKVRQAMRELGYEPNFQASNLASQNSHTIGIILPPSEHDAYENSFYLEMIRGISQFCNVRQYTNTVIIGKDNDEILEGIRTMARSGQANGFIVLYSRMNDPITEYLYNEGLLYVLIGKAYSHVNETIYIDNDNVLAGKEAAECLIRLGHQKIAYLSPDSSLLFASDRRTGYLSALMENRLEFRPDYCVEVKGSGESDMEKLKQLLTMEDAPTAILVSDDILAMILRNVCADLGLSIPRDLSIVSFNNSLLAKLSVPKLTSMDVNSRQLGTEAAAQLISHIEHPDLPATKIIVPHFLVERESCFSAAKQ